ncbi:MAG: class I SAM-dependent methyltransferase [Nitrospiraceae bacterium]|nr:class I SAM-dependent methyltransferase [Nitrospiraceae bacterium]
MDDLAKEYVISFFSKSLQLHGDRPEAVRWTPPGQIIHYKCMLDIAPSIEGATILDFGCGKGDFYGFLRDNGITVSYTGFDINPELVALARQKYPEVPFSVFDITRDELTADFDYIFLCGVFNLKVQGLDDLIRLTLKKLFPHCRTGLAYNGLSAHAPHKDFELHYVYPGDMLSFAIEELTPAVTLRQDRLFHDFTLFAYQRSNPFPDGWTNSSF